MSTLSDIATDIVASIAADQLGYPVVAKWAQLRYQQLSTRVKLKHLRQLGQVNIPAAVTAGTASFTLGSTTVTLDATAATAFAVVTNTGWYIRGSVAWYEILGVRGTTVTLKQPYTEASVTAGGYVAVSRYTPLDPRASWIGRSWMHARRRRSLVLTTMDQLNRQAPYRPLLTTSGPTHIAEGPEINGVKTIEVYPYSSTLEALFYVYWQDIPEFSLTEELSPRIKAYALKEGVLIDCYRYLMNDALNKNAIERAGFYGNLSAKQETKWDGYLQELVLADQGDDDGSFILNQLGKHGHEFADIRTARDQVWSR